MMMADVDSVFTWGRRKAATRTSKQTSTRTSVKVFLHLRQAEIFVSWEKGSDIIPSPLRSSSPVFFLQRLIFFMRKKTTQCNMSFNRAMKKQRERKNSSFTVWFSRRIKTKKQAISLVNKKRSKNLCGEGKKRMFGGTKVSTKRVKEYGLLLKEKERENNIRQRPISVCFEDDKGERWWVNELFPVFS